MNENAVSHSGSMLISGNEHFKELLTLLQENGRDTSGLTAILNHISVMELFVKRAEDNIAAMKLQLSEMKEVQNHPIKTQLQNTIKALEARVAEVKVRLAEFKAELIQNCKDAIALIKDKGAASLGGVLSIFRIKDGLLRLKQSVDGIIRADDNAIEKIEAFAKEYHSAGNAIKNMARVAVGRKPVNPQKEAGKLAKGLAAPYMAQKSSMVGLLKTIDKTIVSISKFEQSEKTQKSMRTEGQRRSLLKNLEANKARVERAKLDVKIPVRTPKAHGVEL